jgi:hypothetical protein
MPEWDAWRVMAEGYFFTVVVETAVLWVGLSRRLRPGGRGLADGVHLPGGVGGAADAVRRPVGVPGGVSADPRAPMRSSRSESGL